MKSVGTGYGSDRLIQIPFFGTEDRKRESALSETQVERISQKGLKTDQSCNYFSQLGKNNSPVRKKYFLN